jgi:hypothetical protein
LYSEPSSAVSFTDGAEASEAVLEDREGREFILAQLAQGPGESSQALAAKCATYLKKIKGKSIELSRCQARIEELAQQMLQEGLVKSTRRDEGLFLTLS